jgi:phosphoglycerate dehydrogenase-like enzyme
MANHPAVLVLAWVPDGAVSRLAAAFPSLEIIDARDKAVRDRHLARAVITYGLPPVDRLAEAVQLRWVQLSAAGVPRDLGRVASARGLTVTNLAGLYGPGIAEHALALMLILSRNLHLALRNQQQALWDRSINRTMRDLHGQTLAIIGLGNIGRAIARLARAHGIRVVGCQWPEDRPVPEVDRLYPCRDLHDMLAEADIVAVAAPLTEQTVGMLGPAEFAAMKHGALYVNVSRGAVAREEALLDALRSGQVGAAGLDVFSVEPLPPDHPFWTMPQVVISPHYSGETVNTSSLPVLRFQRNLHNWLTGRPLEGLVILERGF